MVVIVACVKANLDSQTSYAADILRCVDIVDIVVDSYMDVVTETDDMLVREVVYHASLIRSFCKPSNKETLYLRSNRLSEQFCNDSNVRILWKRMFYKHTLLALVALKACFVVCYIESE